MVCNKLFSGRSICRKATITFLSLFLWTSVHADLVLSAPPRESAADGLKQYGPLADQLSEILGEKVTYQQPKGWMYYQRDMRADKYDIIFDGPHFMSWRIKQFGHIPVAKLPGKLGFVVITKKNIKGFNNREVNTIDDLMNVTVCSIAPPNLSSLTVLSKYEDPVSLPMMVPVKGGMNGVYKAFKSGKCKAAILRDKFYAKKVSEQERAELKIIFKSDPVANQGITVSTRVNEEQRTIIAATLTEAGSGITPTLKRFSPKSDKMLFTDKADFDGYYELLVGVVYGWEINSKLIPK